MLQTLKSSIHSGTYDIQSTQSSIYWIGIEIIAKRLGVEQVGLLNDYRQIQAKN